MQIETPRLLLRDFTLDDVEALTACRADERFWRYYDRVDDIEARTREHIELFLSWQAVQPRTHFQLAIVLKQDGSLVGDCGLRQRVQASYGGQAELGYELNPERWGNGYATEAAEALVAYGFETLKLHRVWATCRVENGPSWRLMERLGMRREGVFEKDARLNGRWADSYLYALLEDEWRSRT